MARKQKRIAEWTMDPDVRLAIDHAHDLIVFEEFPHTDAGQAAFRAGSNAGLRMVAVYDAVAHALGARLPCWGLNASIRSRGLTRNDVLAALCRAREG